MTGIRAWHGVFNGTDLDASHPANIDVACMLVAFTEPEVVVEAGTYQGHFAFATANIMRRIGRGKVYTADIVDRGVEKKLLDPPGQLLAPHIHIHLGDFRELLDTVPTPIDMGYIDASDPNNEHLRYEHASLVYERLRPGGLILVDDTAATDWSDAKFFRWRAGIHLSQHRGLSIIQKPYA